MRRRKPNELMTERECQADVAGILRRAGWDVQATAQSEGSKAGDSDLRCTWAGPGPCPGRRDYIEVELKHHDGTRRHHRTDAQRAKANARILAGIPALECLLPHDARQLERWFGLAPFALPFRTTEDDDLLEAAGRPAPRDEESQLVAELMEREGFQETAARRAAAKVLAERRAARERAGGG